MSSVIKKDWTTKAGYRALVIYVNGSHNCGYVVLPESHPAYKFPYYEFSWDNEGEDKEVSSIQIAVNDIYVHGGLTFASNTIADENLQNSWVFGFDAAHLGDATNMLGEYGDPDDTFKDIDYMADECETLADQLKLIKEK